MYSQNLVDDDDRVAEIVRAARRVAVLGMKGEDRREEAAFFVPEFLLAHGFEVIPVAVREGGPEEILGVPVVRRLGEVAGPVDVVCVFRRGPDVAQHVQDLLALRPRCVWMQRGIRNDAAAEALARAGILVVQDRCLMAEYRRVATPSPPAR
jgi:predicted CoA-binding protein